MVHIIITKIPMNAQQIQGMVMLTKRTYHPYELRMGLQFKSIGGKFVSVVIKNTHHSRKAK